MEQAIRGPEIEVLLVRDGKKTSSSSSSLPESGSYGFFGVAQGESRELARQITLMIFFRAWSKKTVEGGWCNDDLIWIATVQRERRHGSDRIGAHTVRTRPFAASLLPRT